MEPNDVAVAGDRSCEVRHSAILRVGLSDSVLIDYFKWRRRKVDLPLSYEPDVTAADI